MARKNKNVRNVVPSTHINKMFDHTRKAVDGKPLLVVCLNKAKDEQQALQARLDAYL